MTYTNTVDLLTYIKSKMVLDKIQIKDLAEKMHKSQSATSSLLRQENISLETLKDICDALEYTLEINIYNKNDVS